MKKLYLNSWITLLAFVILGCLISYISFNLVLHRVRMTESATDVLTFETWLKPVIMFIIMIVGILFNLVYTAASQASSAKSKSFSPMAVLSGIKGNPRLWMAICVTPFVFYTIYYYTKEQPDYFSGAFIAFQNGFFWQAIFNGFKKKVD